MKTLKKEWDEIMNTVWDMKVEIKSLKKVQIEINLKIKKLGSQIKVSDVITALEVVGPRRTEPINKVE